MKSLLLTALLLSCSIHAYADELSASQKASVQKLIQAFKAKDVNAISQAVQYPLERPKPLPAINNANEFKTRFNQVFDGALQNQIAQSKLSDWEQVGWRGIMLHDGVVWVSNVDEEDKSSAHATAKITAVNHLSAAEKQWQQQLLTKQKNGLHPSLQSFAKPEMVFTTPKYLVRIDLLKNGKYRYAVWNSKQDQSSQPNLVLNNGTVTSDGSGGNHYFDFKSGPYAYHVYRHVIGGESDAEVSLQVSKNGEVVVEEDGRILR